MQALPGKWTDGLLRFWFEHDLRLREGGLFEMTLKSKLGP